MASLSPPFLQWAPPISSARSPASPLLLLPPRLHPVHPRIPSPTAADDHQTKNAYIMADIAGSKVLTEEELDSSSLKTAINEVLGDENLMAEMSEMARRASRPNAASDIARCILSLVEPSSP